MKQCKADVGAGRLALRKSYLWVYLYFVLAAIAVLVVGFTMYRSIRNVVQYTQSLQKHSQDMEIIELLAKISLAAQQMNAPGNDVFESHNVEKEKNRFLVAQREFHEVFKTLTQLMKSHESDSELEQLQTLNRAMLSMESVALKIFDRFENEDTQKVSRLMAEMDQYYHQFQAVLSVLSASFPTRMLIELKESEAKAIVAQEFEYLFSGLILLVIIGLAIYGYHLKNHAKRSAVIETRNQEIINALNASAIVAFTDRNGVITEVNENFCKISGYTRDELIGKTHRVVSSGAHSKQFFKTMWDSIASGKAWSGDIQNKTKEGSTYFVRSVMTPLRNFEGKIEQFMAIRFDVTESKYAESLLSEAQQIAKIGSWKYDFRTGRQSWSSEHYRIFEIPEPQTQELLYRLYRERIHPDDVAQLDQVVERAKRFGEDFVYNHRVYLDGGKRIKYVRGIGKVTKDSWGTPVFISGTCQDLTDQTLLELNLQNERAKATHSAKLASLGEMSAGVAHEINNPLAMIAGNLRLLPKCKNDEAKFNSKLAAIEKAAGRIEKIVKGLRKFSRTSGKSERKLESVNDIINEVMVLTEAKSKRHTTPITKEVENDLFIFCDAVEIEQVLVNLINNGIDAVKRSKDSWIRLRAFGDNDAVVIQVIDSGSGIPSDVERKLFQPFFTTKAVGEGTGLGLSISKGIIEDHQGSLELNRDHKNTCFEIRFAKAQKTSKEKEGYAA